ncbi:MAG: regulator of chromosome condensation [Thermoleophilia bacterium]|nr:regulator of chromosome condensation [Thermoleophilia bacterium]
MSRLITTLVLSLAAFSAFAMHPVASHAAAGDYAVRFTTTGGSHWESYGRGPFIAVANRVYSGQANFAMGDYRSWRAGVLGSGSRIIGGRVGISLTTPTANMRGRIVAGTGNSPVELYDSDGTGNVERSFTGTYDWVQFDLRSAAAVSTTAVAQNSVDLRFVELTLHDSVPPALAPISLPDPGRWYGAGDCIPYTVRVTDQGGGLLRSQVRRASDGAVVFELASPQAESTKPGLNEQHVADCIHPTERGHGDTTFVVTTWDVGGTARELVFSVRADHQVPTIAGGPADGARMTTTTPTIAFEVADVGAGLAGVSGSLDGAAVPVTMSAGVATVQVGDLARGTHVIAIAAVDGAGNATRVERRVTVADDAPPVMAVASPGARGESSITLTVKASDDQSGIDPVSWTAKLDGTTIAFTADATQLSAKLGPLADGAHRIDVTVRDLAGNLATMAHAYYVIPPPPPPAPAPAPSSAELAGTAAAAAAAAVATANTPGRSGVALVDGPRGAVGHGRTATVTIQVVRDGGPVGSQLVEVRRDDAVIGSGLTDAAGVVRIAFVAAKPGRYQAVAVGQALEPLALGVRVAPRLVITTSLARPRVGQRVLITGRMYPAIRGRRVAVEAKVDGVWFPIRRAASTDGTGRFRSSVTPTSPGPVTIRVRLLAVGAWAPAVSNLRVLRARS